jgi:hypothetical protein
MTAMRISILLAILVSFPASGAIVITPAQPKPSDAITIGVENTFGMQAVVDSATITRDGSSFVIHQNVSIGCLLPSNPVVASSFSVGSLPPGIYNVTAIITFVNASSLCPFEPRTQTAAFAVTDPDVPALEAHGLVLLTIALAAGGLVTIRLRSS